jgi:hypothetical protein
MSRYTVSKSYPNGVTMTYAYGYDRPLQEFFLSFKDSRTYTDQFIWFVGMGGCHPGNNGEMLKAIQFFELLDVIPANHMKCITDDRPIPEQDTNPPHMVAGRLVVIKDGPDGEQYLSLAD